jgi:diguanylate cyclase (GGDEF)-like protein/excisionase family DNA binding protein
MTAQPDPRPADATLSVTRAAVVLGVHPNTVRAWSEQGRLRYYRINARGDRRYRVGDLRRFLADAERGSSAGGPAARAVDGRAVDAGTRPDAQARTMPAPELAGASRIPAGPGLRPLADYRLIDGSSRANMRRSVPGPTARLADAPPPAAPGIRHLTDLAGLAASGRTLDAVLHDAARLLRDATRATDVAIWEVRDDRLARRASAGTGARPGVATHATIAGSAVAQRRPVVETLGNPSEGTPALEGAPIVSIRSLAGARDDGSRRPALDIAVPIVTDGPWGAVTARLPALAACDEAVVWLEASAALLAAAIRSALQMEAAASAIHRAEALRHVAMDTGGSLDLGETLGRIADHALVLFAADRTRIAIRQSDGSVLAELSRGLSPAYLAAVRDAPSPSLASDSVYERRPLSVTAYRDDPRSRAFRAAVVQEGFDTICAAPLLDGEDAIGVLELCHDRPRPWLPAELETMAVFAAQATVAIRTAQQYGDLGRWAAQLQSIQQLGARLNRLTTVTEIGSAIATELRVLIDYDNIRVYRLEGEDLNAVALRATDDVYLEETPDLVKSRIGEGITGWVAAHGIGQNLPDSSVDPRTEDIPGSDTFDESMLLAPLIFEDRVLGVIALARRGLRQFGDDDLRLLEVYASVAAQAMANSDANERLRAQSAALQRQLRSQRELLDVTESILSTLDPRAVLDQIADRLGRLVRYDTLAIEVYDHRSGMLVPLTAKGPDGEPDPHPAVHGDLAAWVIRHNEARLVPAVAPGGRDGAVPSPLEPALASWILVPLRGRDGVTGVLALSRTQDGESFTGDEFELVQLFAGQVSIALQNAETHRDVEVRARTDDLTGLLNHGSLREWLARSATAGGMFSLIMLDLDAFKAVNDAFGHQAGDRLLRDIGTAVVTAGRDTDLVFRYGGDEFAVLLPGTDATGALQVAGRIRDAVREVARPGGARDDVEITASIGVATFPLDATTGPDMLLAADRACFVAKRGGRDRIADAAVGLALATQFSLQEPTPVDSSDPRWSPPAGNPAAA